jgi:predicted transcriptional regulator
MESFTTQDLIAELQKFCKPAATRRPGGITVDEWAKEQGCSDETAGKQLRGLMDQGILEREWSVCEDGRRYVYYKT